MKKKISRLYIYQIMVQTKNIISGKNKKNRKIRTANEISDDSLSELNMKRMFIRPILAAGLSLIYGNYLDNRNLMSSKELMRAGILGGSVLVADKVGNMIFPHLMLSKLEGAREIENMAIEPLITGLLYSGGKYWFVDGTTNQLEYDFLKGVTIDLTAGVGEAVVSSMDII
jgi:hypothetical protein